MLFRSRHPQWHVLVRHVLRSKKPCCQLTDTTIVTCFNSDFCKQRFLLKQSLDLFSVPLQVYGRNIVKWRNSLKIGLCLNAFKSITTKYVIVLDATDVVIVQDPQLIVERFKELNCKMLYGVERPRGNDFIVARHLNSGMFVGETEFCSMIYNEAYTRFLKLDVKCDQPYFKLLVHKFTDLIKYDIESHIFHNVLPRHIITVTEPKML